MAFAPPELVATQSSLELKGSWTTRHLGSLPEITFQPKQTIIVEAANISAFDTAGAIFLKEYLLQLDQSGIHYQLKNLKPEWEKLLVLISQNPSLSSPITAKAQSLSFFALIGKEFLTKLSLLLSFFEFIGRSSSTFLQAFKKLKRFHPKSIINTVDQAGCRSLPIVGLLCFLIGIVLAYQLGIQLKNYGANIFIVYLTGIAILREFGPLITAIILAGRTSAAFTAEIGTMKVTQEIDALQTMGLSPNEFLVIPKIIGLIIIFPLLIFWADIFGILGSMVMAKISLGVDFEVFLGEFGRVVSLKQFFIGLSKGPIFALIIALVGCYQGFQVEYSASSVGDKTTRSVVQAIFLIIIADALFSIFYSLAGL